LGVDHTSGQPLGPSTGVIPEIIKEDSPLRLVEKQLSHAVEGKGENDSDCRSEVGHGKKKASEETKSMQRGDVED